MRLIGIFLLLIAQSAAATVYQYEGTVDVIGLRVEAGRDDQHEYSSGVIEATFDDELMLFTAEVTAGDVFGRSASFSAAQNWLFYFLGRPGIGFDPVAFRFFGPGSESANLSEDVPFVTHGSISCIRGGSFAGVRLVAEDLMSVVRSSRSELLQWLGVTGKLIVFVS